MSLGAVALRAARAAVGNMGCCPCFGAKKSRNNKPAPYSRTTSGLSNSLLDNEDRDHDGNVSMKQRSINNIDIGNSSNDNNDVILTYQSPLLKQSSIKDSDVATNTPIKRGSMKNEKSRTESHNGNFENSFQVVRGESLLSFDHYMKQGWINKRGQTVNYH